MTGFLLGLGRLLDQQCKKCLDIVWCLSQNQTPIYVESGVNREIESETGVSNPRKDFSGISISNSKQRAIPVSVAEK